MRLKARAREPRAATIAVTPPAVRPTERSWPRKPRSTSRSPPR